MRTRWIVLALASCTSASSNDPDDLGAPLDVAGQNGACTAFEGRQFESVDQHECGLGPGGIVMCTWHIEFAAIDAQRTRFMWQHSDVIENGSVRCTGGQVATDGIGRVYTGGYDRATRLLTWDKLAYRLP